jgi:hypothetical protein
MSCSRRFSALLAIVSLSLPGAARATGPVVDGHLDPDYGAARVTQTAQTRADDTVGAFDASNGQELDAGYGLIRDGVLYLMLTGNVWLEPDPIEPGTDSNPCHIFLDTGAGGQDTVRTPPYPWSSPLANVVGLRFDAGFSADHWFGFYGGGGPDFSTPYDLHAFLAALPPVDPDTVTYLGAVSPVNSAAFAGGTNPAGIQLAVDNSNAGGVGAGCGATGSGAGATTGIEVAIPLAAIGNPTGPIRVCAFLTDLNEISNQVLGPVPSGACTLGAPNTVDFSSIPGPQYFVVNPEGSGVPPPPVSASLALAAAPTRGAGVTVRINLPTAAPAELDMTDAGGRRVRAFPISAGAGPHTLTVAAPGALPAGVYFLRLAQGARAVTARAIVIP